MTPYLVVYSIVWLCAIIGSATSSKTGDRLFFIQSAILVSFSALKFETGYDWPVYERNYHEKYITFEPGYEALTHIFRQLGFSFQAYHSIIGGSLAFGISCIIYKIAPRHKNIVLAILFSISDLFLIPTFSIIRQTISGLILITALIQLERRNFILATTLFFVSPLFHLSSILIALYSLLASCILRNKLAAYLLFFFASTLYIFSIDIFGSALLLIVKALDLNYLSYFERDTFNASIYYKSAYLTLSFFLLHFLFFGFRSKLLNSCFDNEYARKLAIIGIITPLLLHNYPTYATRLLFFSGFFIATYSLIPLLQKKKFTRLVLTAALSIVFFFPFYRFLSSPLSIPFVPYQNIIQHTKENSTGPERTQELLDLLHALW